MKTDAIIIMDGFGYRTEARGNAVIAAGTPELDRLMAKYPHTLIVIPEVKLNTKGLFDVSNWKYLYKN